MDIFRPSVPGIRFAWAWSGFGPGTTFTGLLDGNGGISATNYTISDLTLSSSTSPVGLFGFIGTGATVRNLNLANVSITGTHNTMFLGTLAGQNNGTISNVNVTDGTVTGGSHTGFSDENPEITPDPRQAQHDATTRYATPFLLEYLAHKNAFARRLRSSDDGIVALIARPK